MFITSLENLTWLYPRWTNPAGNAPSAGDRHGIEVCNRLLREEISAVATYNRLITQCPRGPQTRLLRRIREDHREAVERLQCNVLLMGGQPDTDRREVSAFTSATRVTADLPVDKSAIGSIERVERRVHGEYAEALGDDELMPAFHEVIRRELLPKIDGHLAALDQLAAA